MGGFTALNIADQVGLIAFVVGGIAAVGAVILLMVRARHRKRNLQEGWLDPIQLQEILLGTRPLLVDLRDPEGFLGPEGHIRGSLNIPFAQLGARIGELSTRDSRPVVFVAVHEEHVREAMALARRSGHTWVYGLDGGLAAWRRAQRPLVMPAHVS